jgi:LysR family hydrogen peroxide-inducible transcriptional activator
VRYETLPITLRQLQYVCAVAEELSFRRAAERCHVSQPSLSAQIAELERMLDVVLFERDRRGVLLTPAGEQVVARARTVLRETEVLLDTARTHVDPLAGTLRLGVIPTVGPYLIPDLDPALRESFPRLQLRWTEDKTESLVQMIQAGELDAGLLALESELAGLEHAEIAIDEFVLAASREHPLGKGRSSVPTSALADQQVLLLDDGHCFRDQALDLCTTAGAAEQGFRATSLATLVQMVAGGSGLTILPSMAVEVENRRGRLQIRKFRKPAPARTLVLAWRRGSPLGPWLERLAKAARRAEVPKQP